MDRASTARFVMLNVRMMLECRQPVPRRRVCSSSLLRSVFRRCCSLRGAGYDSYAAADTYALLLSGPQSDVIARRVEISYIAVNIHVMQTTDSVPRTAVPLLNKPVLLS